MKRIGIVGDFKPDKHTHIALNKCVEHIRPHVSNVSFEWVPTNTLPNSPRTAYDAYWIAPGSPYTNDYAVYDLIRWSRENDYTILGICGGFQYMVVEYARNVLGIHGSGHEESEPDAEALIISKLDCSLKGSSEPILITDRESWLFKVLGTKKYDVKYNCAFGINPKYKEQLNCYPLVFTAFSDEGQPRAFELTSHRFFRGTLFQPPLNSTSENPNPLILDFATFASNQ